MSVDSAEDERRAYRREKTRKWRAANPEKSREINRKSVKKANTKKRLEIGDDAFVKLANAASRKSYQSLKNSRPDFLGLHNKRTNAYREANREKVRAQERARWAASPELRAKKAARAKAVPEKFAEYSRTYRKKFFLRSMLRMAQSRANALGREFELTEVWAEGRWTGRCELTDTWFVFSTGSNGKRGSPCALSPSIDRIDSSRGYTKDNCRFVLWAFNRFKGSDDDGLILAIAKSIVANAHKLKTDERRETPNPMKDDDERSQVPS